MFIFLGTILLWVLVAWLIRRPLIKQNELQQQIIAELDRRLWETQMHNQPQQPQQHLHLVSDANNLTKYK